MFRGIVIVLAIIGVIAFTLLVMRQNQTVIHDPPVVAPALNPYHNTVAASGLVEAFNDNVMIGVPVAGLVSVVHVNAWDKVSAGQPLFQIDRRELESQHVVQQASLSIARVNLDKLQNQLLRLQDAEACDHRMICLEDMRLLEKEILIGRAQVELAAAQVFHTETLLDRLIVRAPKNGVILQSNIHSGEFVDQKGVQAALILGNIDRLQIRVDIDEQDAWQIHGNEQAVAYPKNHTNLSIPLRFERIEPLVIPKKSLTGSSDERVDTRVLQIIFSLSPPAEFPLYVGQQAEVFIKVHEQKNGASMEEILVVPHASEVIVAENSSKMEQIASSLYQAMSSWIADIVLLFHSKREQE